MLSKVAYIREQCKKYVYILKGSLRQRILWILSNVLFMDQ